MGTTRPFQHCLAELERELLAPTRAVRRSHETRPSGTKRRTTRGP
jgi:hypothetical protein